MVKDKYRFLKISMVIVGIFLIITTVLYVNNIKTERELKKEDSIQTEIPREYNYEDLSGSEILDKSIDGVENFTYSLYTKTDKHWYKELSDEELLRLEVLGGKKEGLDGYTVELISGQVASNKEYFNYLTTEYDMGNTQLHSVQQYFDYTENKVYSSVLDNVNGVEDWEEKELEETVQLSLKDFLNDIEVEESIEESEDCYSLKGTLKIDKENSENLNWIYYNLCIMYGVDITQEVPLTLEISKKTGYLSKINYNLDHMKGIKLNNTHEISNIDMYYSFVNINNTKIDKPKGIK